MAEQKTNEEEVTEKQFPSIDYEHLLPKLPFDEEGFVQSFEVVVDDDSELQSENKKEIQAFFDKYGVVVLRNMLSDDALSKTVNETMDYVEYWHPKFKRNDTTTWKNISGISERMGIIGDVVMSKQISLNRCNPKIYRAWQLALNDDDVFTNIARVSYMRPTKDVLIGDERVDKAEWKTAEGQKWVHLDMDPLTNHCTTYGFNATDYHKTAEVDTYKGVRAQGVLALVDCRECDGGFQCIPGFHRIHREWIGNDVERIRKRIYKHDPHRYHFESEDPALEFVTKCPLRRGSLLIWNSKLPHNNYPNDSERPRMVQYIRYASKADPAVSRVQLDVDNEGPWGRWNKHMVKLDVTNQELGEIGRKAYCVDEQNGRLLPKCQIL